MRGQMSFTPHTSQPAWIIQNTSGTFSLYGSPLLCGTSQWCWFHISQATASVRVEYIGIGPWEKIPTRATMVQTGSHGHRARRCSRREKLLGCKGGGPLVMDGRDSTP